jgi:hypothetical protein
MGATKGIEKKQFDPGVFWCMPVNVTDGTVAFHRAVKILVSMLQINLAS